MKKFFNTYYLRVTSPYDKDSESIPDMFALLFQILFLGSYGVLCLAWAALLASLPLALIGLIWDIYRWAWTGNVDPDMLAFAMSYADLMLPLAISVTAAFAASVVVLFISSLPLYFWRMLATEKRPRSAS